MRLRVEVNIKKLSSDERAQFRSAQGKVMDQWISNDVISVCQGGGIPKKQRVMTMRWVHTWKVDENTRETKAKAGHVVKGCTDPDLTEIRSESPTLFLCQRRSRADTDKLAPSELTQLRGVSGSASWLGNQTRPDLCEYVSSPRCTRIGNCG